jgi:hypothetical protein
MFGIHSAIEDSIQDALKPENVGPNIFAAELERKGITLSRKQLNALSKLIKKSSKIIKINFEDEQIEKSDFTTKSELSEYLNSIVANFDTHVEKYTSSIETSSIEALPVIIDDISTKILMHIKSNFAALVNSRSRSYNSFSRRLGMRWKIPLDNLQCLIAVTDEFAEGYLAEQRNYLNTNILPQIFCRMMGKANQIAKEIHVLLKNGYADGAIARWRSLHELSVISMFICEQGHETGQMYVDHELIEKYQAIVSHNIHCDKFGEYPIAQDVVNLYKQSYEDLLRKYGNEFKSQYGWAIKATNNKHPTFREIEEKVKYDMNRPFYKTASANIHISAYGVHNSLGLFSPDSVIVGGPSNIGLSTPGKLTCNSLALTAFSITIFNSTLDFNIACKVISDLANEAMDSFLETEDELTAEFNTKPNPKNG